jgi:hypothetical protein
VWNCRQTIAARAASQCRGTDLALAGIGGCWHGNCILSNRATVAAAARLAPIHASNTRKQWPKPQCASNKVENGRSKNATTYPKNRQENDAKA